jgi:pyruvate formate lyase activating enzyme
MRRDSPGILTRRSFIAGCSAFLASGIPSPLSSLAYPAFPPHEALFYKKLEEKTTGCGLCPHECMIRDGERGICGVRENRNGILYSLVYGLPCSIHIDPIEKKPFFHFLPGSSSLSVSTVGCNMTCKFCQNWQISQSSPDDIDIEPEYPESIVRRARDLGTSSISFTYGEPVVFYEYMTDISLSAREKGLYTAVVTNGYYSPEAILRLCDNVDAVKIDLKSFNESYYKTICGATLQPVLDSMKIIKNSGTWMEIVYLMVPGLNDSRMEISRMSDWIVTELGVDVPVHISRFFPQYRLSNLPPTPISSLEAAYKIMSAAGIRYVYIGNLPDHISMSTYCHSCGKKIISRKGYIITSRSMNRGNCGFCGEEIPGIWS